MSINSLLLNPTTSFALNRFELKFCRVCFTLDVHMPRLTPVIRVKEKAIPAFTKDRWHPTSLADEASDAKPLMVGNTNRSFCCRDSAQPDQLLVRRLLAKTFGVALAKAGQPSTLRSLNHFFK